MSVYKASRHEATGYSPNFLTLRNEVRMRPDIIYGSPSDDHDKDCDLFVKWVKEISVATFAEVRDGLKWLQEVLRP